MSKRVGARNIGIPDQGDKLNPKRTYRSLKPVRELLHQDQERLAGCPAYELGYESESAFSNAFKRVMGYSPKSLRMRKKSLQAANASPSGKNGATYADENVPFRTLSH